MKSLISISKYIVLLLLGFMIGSIVTKYFVLNINIKKTDYVIEKPKWVDDKDYENRLNTVIDSISAKQYQGIISYTKGNLVSSEQTAVAIAEAIMFPIYGEECIRMQSPYSVCLINNKYWKVCGNLPAGAIGGTFYIIINKSDGQILYGWHGK